MEQKTFKEWAEETGGGVINQRLALKEIWESKKLMELEEFVDVWIDLVNRESERLGISGRVVKVPLS